MRSMTVCLGLCLVSAFAHGAPANIALDHQCMTEATLAALKKEHPDIQGPQVHPQKDLYKNGKQPVVFAPKDPDTQALGFVCWARGVNEAANAWHRCNGMGDCSAAGYVRFEDYQERVEGVPSVTIHNIGDPGKYGKVEWYWRERNMVRTSAIATTH